MPKDRKADRHDKDVPAHLFRPRPADLWDRLGAVVGVKQRSAVISDLIARYLDGKPMPPLPEPPAPPSAETPAKAAQPGRIRPIARRVIPPKRP